MIPILFIIPKFSTLTFVILILLTTLLSGFIFLLFRKKADSVKELKNDMTGYYFFVIIILLLLYFFGPFPVRTYGVAVALGFLTAIFAARRLCKKSNINPDIIFDMAVYALIGAIIGTRLFYVIFYDLEYFIRNPLKIFAIWEGGLVFYGGLIGGIISGVYFIKKKKLDLLKMIDISGTVIPLGLAFGRMGCLGYGCCYGKIAPEWFPFKIKFPAFGNKLTGHTPAFNAHLHDGLVKAVDNFSLPVYPTQIISNISCLLIFILLWFLFRKKKFDGQIAAFSLIFYAVTRFLIEFLRTEPSFLLLSISQWVGIATLILGILLMNYAKKQDKRLRRL